MKEKHKSYFATDKDFFYWNDCIHSTIELNFDCLFDGAWKPDIAMKDSTREAIRQLREWGYSIYLSGVPEDQTALDWLDKSFDGDGFGCNDDKCYQDHSDNWTRITRKWENKLCKDGLNCSNRYVKFNGNWEELLQTIKEDDAYEKEKREKWRKICLNT